MTTPTVQPLVVGVDVGSVRREGGFAWAVADDSASGQDDPSAVGRLIVGALSAGRRVALAVECPLSVPVPSVEGDDWTHLGRARTGEGNRSWSAGAGTGALATGLVQLSWLCDFIVANTAATVTATTSLDRFAAGTADLLLAEAMVTAEGKPEAVDGHQDRADALAAARRLTELVAQAEDERDVTCHPRGALNLAAAAALRAGMTIADELRSDVTVAKVKPV